MSDNPFSPAADHGGPTDYGPDTLEPPRLDIGELFNRSWEVMKDNLGTIIGIAAVQIGINVVFAVINQFIGVAAQGLIENEAIEAAIALQVVSFIVQIVGSVVSLWIGLGAIRAFVNMCSGRMATVGMLFGEGPKLIPAIGVGLVTGIATALGVFLLIVPGIIVGIGLQFALYELVDKEADIGSALTTSWNMAWPNQWFLFGFSLMVGFGAILAVLLTCFLAVPVLAVFMPVLQANVYLAVRHAYDQQLELDMAY